MAAADLEVLPDLPPMAAAFARALVPAPRRPAAVAGHAVLVPGHVQDPARLARYARVCGFTLRDTVPPTWLHVLAFPLHLHLLTDPATTLRLPGLVHASNRMRQLRPVAVGERLDLQVGIGNLRPHRRGALVDLTAGASVADEPVWEGVSTYLAAGAELAGTAEGLPREEFTAVTPTALWRLPAGLGRQYREVSGDPNPIHTSRLAAKAFGFARPIVHGMWTHARALAALENRLPASYGVAAEFTRPILLPGTVGFSAVATPGGWRAAVTSRDGSRPHLLITAEA
ncbi:MAG: MaoC/PaaZ C-terminal domain-containing protein, partial [Propionicimonas sp.]|nr:MaoC/PaaZ C-terminal domain-containing protein [Propionicimonas sp.]